MWLKHQKSDISKTEQKKIKKVMNLFTIYEIPGKWFELEKYITHVCKIL